MKRPALAVDKGTSNSDPIGAISRRSVLHLSGLAGAGILMPGLLAGCRGSSNPSYEAAAEEARTAAGEVLGQGQVTSLVIALTDAQGLVWVKGFGLADRSTAAAPTGDTLYGIGSGSKMYAAVAVMQLVERGQVDLDAPFHQYVPQFTMFSPESMDVTVRMLLDHSSGLPGTDFRNVYSTVPGADYHTQLLDTVSHQRLKARPGYMSVYCNDGFTLVESLVKAVTGLDYPAYVAQNILAPLGMTRSQYGNVLLPEGTAAKAYGADGAVRPQEYSLLFATGGLFSTANEHAAFARALLNGGAGDHARILTPASVSAMGTDQTVGTFRLVDEASFAYGLGWDSVRQPGLAAVGVRAWSKGGDTINYHSETLVAPDQGLAVVVLQATSGDAMTRTAERVLMRALAERGTISFPAPLQNDIPKTDTPPAALIAAMKGAWANYGSVCWIDSPDGMTITIAPIDARDRPIFAGLVYRNDGWFSSDADPLRAFRAFWGDGRAYLAIRYANGYNHYLTLAHYAQQVSGPGQIRPSWQARAQMSWVPVNEPASSLSWSSLVMRFDLLADADLPGLLRVRTPFPSLPLVDASITGSTDARAPSCLVIPGIGGRDVNDLEALDVDGTPGLRVGSEMLRPMPTIPALARNTSTSVTIGAEGHAVWRTVEASSDPVPVHITGVQDWKTFDGQPALLASGTGAASVTLPSATGRRFLLLFGKAGDTISVQLQ